MALAVAGTSKNGKMEANTEEKISEQKAMEGDSLIKIQISNKRQFAAFILMERLVYQIC